MHKGNDHQFGKFLIAKQILLVSTLRNVSRTEWRIYILIFRCKGLTVQTDNLLHAGKMYGVVEQIEI